MSGRRRFLLACAVFVALVAAALVLLLFAFPPRLPRGSIRFIRGEDGELAPASPTKQGAGLHFGFKAARLDSKDNMVSWASAVSPDRSRFACRRVAVLNLSDHLLLRRVGPAVARKLGAFSGIEEVNYYPVDAHPEPGTRTPDLFVALDLEDLDKTGGPLSRNLKARIAATVGTAYARSHVGYMDDLTPPLIRLMRRITLEHTSARHGPVSRSEDYRMVADNISEQLSKDIVKSLRELQEKHGGLPELPDTFYPPYREAELPASLWRHELQMIGSWHGLMNHNDTFWTCHIDDPSGEIARMAKALEARGWHVTADEKQCHLRAFDDEDVLEVFRRDRGERPGTAGSGPAQMYVRYVDRMSEPELSEAINGTLTEETPTDVMLLFSGHWHRRPGQREAAMSLLESRRLATPEAWTALARLYLRQGREEDARAALLRTSALLKVVARPGPPLAKAKGVAEELGREDLLEQDIPLALYRELGFLVIGEGEDKVRRSVGVDEPLRVVTADSPRVVFSARILESRTDEGVLGYALSYLYNRSDGGRSWGKTGLVGENSPLRQTLCEPFGLSARKTPGEERFVITLERNRGR